MKIQVLRLNLSSYQDELFLNKEKIGFNEIDNVEYIESASELAPDSSYVLITNTHTEVDKIAANILQRTALVIHPNSGHDNISSEFISTNTFPIIRGNVIRSNAVSEYILSCLFKHFVQIKNQLFWDKTRKWDRKLISDLNILIIGHGHIGSSVANCLKPLCKKLKVVDPNSANESIHPKVITEYKDSIFKDIDVLIIAADLNPTTKNLIEKTKLDMMSDDVLIINGARGEIINQTDLERHLKLNPSSFAYLDVFENEPFKSSDFKDLRNLNKTSHIAGVFKDLNSKIIEFETQVVKDFLTDTNSFVTKYSKDILK